MNEYEIPLSKTSIKRQIVVSGVLILIACGVVTFFFDKLVSSFPILQDFMLTILWVALPLLWLISSGIALKSWPKLHYVLGDDSLRVRTKGWFGNSTEELYRYDTILSVSSVSRNHGAYGSLTLNLAQQNPIVINNIELPEEQARRIKERVSSGKPAASVSL